MIRSMIEEHASDWEDHVPYVTMVYRATIHESTKCTPNLLMFGSELRMPLENFIWG